VFSRPEDLAKSGSYGPEIEEGFRWSQAEASHDTSPAASASFQGDLVVLGPVPDGLWRSMRVGDVALLVSACQIGPVRD
jgi:hypothetical protein